MDIFFLINQVSAIVISAFCLFLGFWVYFTNTKSRINQFFLWLSVFLFLWIAVCYLGNISTDAVVALFLGKLAYGTVAIFFIPFYFFSIYFLKEQKRFKYLGIFVCASSLSLFLLSIFTDLMVKNMEFTEAGAIPVLGDGKFAYFAIILFLALFIGTRFFVRYFKFPNIEKLKIQYFLIGVSIWISMNLVFNVILPVYQKIPEYWQFGNYSAIFFLGFTAYAIIKRDLFGIKIVLTQTLVGIIAILLLVDVVASETLFEYIWKGILFALFVFLGWLLIRSVLKEIKYREKIKEAYEREVGYRKKIKEAYEIEKKAHKELQRLNEAKTQFIMATQHHLRTPLTSMIGYLDLIFGGIYGKVPQKLGETLKKFEVSTSRLIKVVNELLDISQFQLGKKIVILKDGIDIEPILIEIMEELEAETKTKKIYLKLVKPKKALPLIKADAEKLKVAITNIIDNGVKYTSKGGVTISLKAQMIGAKAKLQIIIKDTGMGIAKEELKTLFSRTFERGEKAKQVYTTGRGIGLYITYQIIKAHNGKIWAESEGRNKGTSFYIELPVD